MCWRTAAQKKVAALGRDKDLTNATLFEGMFLL